jgi:hypothetical protein
VVAAAIVNWGMGRGLIYNKVLACLLLLLIFAQTQPALSNDAGIVCDAFSVRVPVGNSYYRFNSALVAV